MKPNFFVYYVSDLPRSVAWYSDLFEMEPAFVHDSFVPFSLEGGVTFGLYKDHAGVLSGNPPRTAELGLEVEGGNEAVREMWQKWAPKAHAIVSEIQDYGFGETFIIADPDGNHIRVTHTEE